MYEGENNLAPVILCIIYIYKVNIVVPSPASFPSQKKNVSEHRLSDKSFKFVLMLCRTLHKVRSRLRRKR